MNLKVIDFKELTRHYTSYREGVENIEKVKQDFLEKINPIKNQMNEIIKSAHLMSEESRLLKYQELKDMQQEAVSIDNDFKFKMKSMTDELNEKCYGELSSIIESWAEENQIDLVITKVEVAFNKAFTESTSDIIEILKQKNLFVQ